MSKKPFSEDIQIKYELINVNKTIYEKEQKGELSETHSVLQIGRDEVSLLIEVCPSYTFDFIESALIEEKPPISGKYLASLKPLSVGNHITFLVKIYELLTPLTFLHGISEKKPEKFLTFEQTRKEVEGKAREFEAQFMKQEMSNINSIFINLQNEKNKHDALPHFLLASQVRETSDFIRMREKIRKFYYNIDVTQKEIPDQKKYAKAVNAWVGNAIQRIYKSFYQAVKGKLFYCMVRDEKTQNPYSLNEFKIKLMTEHLLDEMALAMVVGQVHNIDYFLHYISSKGKSRETIAMDNLLTLTKRFCLSEDYANKLLCQPLQFVERPQTIKEAKSITPSAPPVISEIRSNLSPIPMTHSGSGDSSDGSSSSGENKSLLSSSSPKTVYTQSDTVTLAKSIYDLLFDLASSSESVKMRMNLIETMKRNNLKKINLPSPKEEITVKMSAYKFLHRLAISDADVEDRIALLRTYQQGQSLPDPCALDLLQFAKNNTTEIKETQTPTVIPVPKPLNNNLPVSSNINAIFNKPQPKASKTKQSQSSSSRKLPQPRSSYPRESRYAFCGSRPGYKWKPKGRTLQSEHRAPDSSII